MTLVTMLLIINIIIMFQIAERLKPIVGSTSIDFGLIGKIISRIKRPKLLIGDYYAYVGYRDIDDFMLEDKLEEIVVVRNFGKKYIEIEIIEERKNQSPVTQQPYNVPIPSSGPKNKYITLKQFYDYYRKYNGLSPGIKKTEFSKDISNL